MTKTKRTTRSAMRMHRRPGALVCLDFLVTPAALAGTGVADLFV